MKALAHLLSIDSSLLADVSVFDHFINKLQANVHGAVHNRFLDSSISVREATIDLVGKYVISKPAFIKQYFGLISDRILVPVYYILIFLLGHWN